MQDILFYKKIADNKKANREFTSDEFQFIYSDLEESIDSFACIVDGIYSENIKDDSWKYYSETLAKKYIIQSSSLLHLLLGTQLNLNSFDKHIILIDVTSLNVILRTLIENYLTLYYLYFEKITDDERRMRWIIYQISGLNSRRKINIPKIQNEEKTILLNREKEQEAHLLEELKTNMSFLQMPEKKRQNILKNKPAKIKNWNELFFSSELKDNFFNKEWKLNSNYAHSEYLSVLQIYDYMATPNDTLPVRNSFLFSHLILTCMLIVDFSELYPELEMYFERLSYNKKRIIRLLNGVGKKRDEKEIKKF